jgi:predicted GNAT superfamily acetyltransferase
MTAAAFDPDSALAIRPAGPADLEHVLRLNRQAEAALSPLTPDRLRALHDQACYHRVACLDGQVRAFLLALGPGAAYDSPNYLWFAARSADFVYIDRVVVDPAARRARLATRLYEDLIAHARRSGAARVGCEYDTEPPNEASRRFHESLGFVEVGAQRVAGGRKRVSLQELRLRCAAI